MTCDQSGGLQRFRIGSLVVGRFRRAVGVRRRRRGVRGGVAVAVGAPGDRLGLRGRIDHQPAPVLAVGTVRGALVVRARQHAWNRRNVNETETRAVVDPYPNRSAAAATQCPAARSGGWNCAASFGRSCFSRRPERSAPRFR